jgi:3-hydroxyacyl-CoA dehydrogenase
MEQSMSILIRKVGVLGAGVMGSGIAAHCANAGIPTLLLDIVPPNPGPKDNVASKSFRNRFAAGALDKLKKTKPSPIFNAKTVDLLEAGNFEDDLGRLAECDLIIEAVKEDIAVKRDLFGRVEAVIRPGTLVASNTSGLTISAMTEGRSESFKQHFLVMHFFNPVRYMKLLELVAGPETKAEAMAAAHKFGEETLGKGIVYGKDTTNFIANRIGVYGIMKTIEEMMKAELTVEEVDKIFGPAMGRPSSAVFRTADIVGLDTFVHVAQNCYDSLVDDEERAIFAPPEFIKKMVAGGMLGDKSQGGFYKKSSGPTGEKVILSLDLNTLEYREQKKVRFDSLGVAKGIDKVGERIAAVLGCEDKAAKFAEQVTLSVLAYASRRLPEIADDIVNVDRGMRWGFGWDVGPFETWDAIGVAKGLARMKELGITAAPWVEAMVASGRTSFYGVDGVADTHFDFSSKTVKKVEQNRRTLKLTHLERGSRKVKENFGAVLWDMGDDIALLEFKTKMNSIDDDIISMMNSAIDICEQDFKGLVIGNGAENFSVGANIMGLMFAAQGGQFDEIRKLVKGFQDANQRMRYSRIPVVSAPAGLTLGGGAEAAMGANAIQAKAETYMGLVEVGVGLIPGGGGNLQLLRNVYGPFAGDGEFDPFPFIKKVFLTIGTAKVATSAEEARDYGFLTAADGVSMNGDFHLNDAKQRALGMYEAGFRPPRPTKFYLPGRSAKATIDMMLYDMQLNGQVSAHDRHIGVKLAEVITGGNCSPATPVTEEYLLELEQEAFLSLCGEEKTHARLAYMLQNGKPLRN